MAAKCVASWTPCNELPATWDGDVLRYPDAVPQITGIGWERPLFWGMFRHDFEMCRLF